MAASSEDRASAAQTLIPSDENPQSTSVDLHMSDNDSTDQSHHICPIIAEENPDPGLEEGSSSAGEKRKRNDPEASEDAEPKSSLLPMWKTSLCSYFRRTNGLCSHGDTCKYAHGEEELRPRPDSSWDPTSQRAKKLIKSENGTKSENGHFGEQGVLMTDAVADSSNPALDKCFVNLPLKWKSDNLRSFLIDQGIFFKSAKKKKGMVVGFVSFDSAEQVQFAVEALDGKPMGNKSLKVVDVIPRSFEKNTKPMPLPQTATGSAPTNSDAEIGDDGDTVREGFTPNNLVTRARSARDVVTPLAGMAYPDQLEHKKNTLTQILKKLTRNARKACPNDVSLPDWILTSRERGGLPCKLEGIIESPILNGYRNKCEFSVGYSVQGKPTVGFMLGNFRAGVTAVEEPVNCPNVSSIACKYALIFQEFLQNSSLPLWNRLDNSGFWRQLTVREGRTPEKVVDNSEANISEAMLVVQVCSVGFDDQLVCTELERMAQAFGAGSTANSPPLPLTVLVVQDHKGVSNVAPADAPLRPLSFANAESDANNAVELRIHDYISNLRFCISPTAFFQVNTLAAEKLYSLAGDWGGLGPDTLLFDICCGTGTIGLTLAHRVGMVVGIEMNASAVSDAQRNSEINGVKNCRFVCAKAEDVMGSLLKEYLDTLQKQEEVLIGSETNKEIIDSEAKGLQNAEKSSGLNTEESSSHDLEYGREETENQIEKGPSENGNRKTMRQQFKNVVCIVDPPRVGLHPVVIKALRTHPRIRRLVYISCNPESLMANAIELCTPSSADMMEKGQKNNRGWRNMSSAGLARHRAKSMPNSEPFQPVKAMAVDLFPHTPHCEMVMLLER